MKKVLALLMAIAIICTLITACGKTGSGSDVTPPANTEKQESTTNTDSAKQVQEILKCKYVLPGQAPQEYDKVQSMINKKMADDGVGVELERQYIPWDAWEQKVNIMLSTGEEFDLLNVMNDWIPLSSYVGKGALTDITAIIDQYGENIKKLNPDIMMNSAKVGGKIYAVPAFWVETSRGPELTIRRDILKKNNLKVPKTVEELTGAFETVMKNWEGKDKPYLPLIGSNSDSFKIAWKTYDTWPFVLVDKIFYVNQNGNIKAYVETEEFKKDCELAHSWYQKKLINPDVLVFKTEQLDAQLESGNWFIHCGTYGNDVANLKKNYPDITVEDFIFHDFCPEKPGIRPYGTRNMNAVPATSKHPETGVKFINWLYANQDNYNLYMYGIEGEHYRKTGGKTRETINDPALKLPKYFADDWMIGNLQFELPNANMPAATRNALFTVDEKVVNSIVASFVFDASNVKAELANVRTELQASIAPLINGVVPYDKGYAAAIEKMKKAGLDRVIEEYKNQFEAFKKNEGK